MDTIDALERGVRRVVRAGHEVDGPAGLGDLGYEVDRLGGPSDKLIGREQTDREACRSWSIST